MPVRAPCLAFCAAALALAAPALAQSNQPRSGEEVATDIAKTPLRDTNIDQKDIPVALEVAMEDPYAPLGTRSCREIVAGLAELNALLGPDLDTPRADGNRAGRVAEGVARGVVASLIPFRGVIRQVSGAAESERRFNAAIDAGIARRGYLRGVADQRRCKLPDPAPVETAKD